MISMCLLLFKKRPSGLLTILVYIFFHYSSILLVKREKASEGCDVVGKASQAREEEQVLHDCHAIEHKDPSRDRSGCAMVVDPIYPKEGNASPAELLSVLCERLAV
jgi:hypothetical protein